MPSALFWTGQPGGTAWYRCITPGRALRRLGWDVEFVDDGFDMTPAGRVRDDPDLLVISRAMGDYVPDAVRRVVACGRTTVVYDVDDWFGAVPDFNPASRLPDELVATMHQAMAEANLITCSTPELAELYAPLGRTVVLPNYLDPDIWSDTERYRTDRDFVTVGWAGAFHWRAGDLELLKPWVYDLLADHPEVRFAAIGCRELLGWLGIDGVTTPMMPGAAQSPRKLSRHLHPYEHLPALLGNLDVGLVPLLPITFNDAKSWCKGMEYNACGVPAVTSPSREYRTFMRDGSNGLLVDGRSWRDAVELVLADLARYRDGARRTAAQYFIDDHIDRWTAAYEEARCVSV